MHAFSVLMEMCTVGPLHITIYRFYIYRESNQEIFLSDDDDDNAGVNINKGNDLAIQKPSVSKEDR